MDYKIVGQWTILKYILNLAIADLLYCTVNMPVLALQYLYHGWYRSKSLCLFFGSLLVVITYAEWMFLAIIALKKCVHLIKPRLGDLIFSGVTGSIILVLIWIYALLVVGFNFLQHIIWTYIYCRPAYCLKFMILVFDGWIWLYKRNLQRYDG